MDNVMFRGKSIQEWAVELAVPERRIYQRLLNGMEVEKAFAQVKRGPSESQRGPFIPDDQLVGVKYGCMTAKEVPQDGSILVHCEKCGEDKKVNLLYFRNCRGAKSCGCNKKLRGAGRNAARYEYQGRMMTIREMSNASGCPLSTVTMRLKSGSSPDQACKVNVRKPKVKSEVVSEVACGV